MDNLNNVIKKQKDFIFKNNFDNKFKISLFEKLLELFNKYEQEIYQAFLLDLNKDEYQTFVSEIFPAIDEIKYFIKNLKKLNKPIKVANDFPSWFTSKNYFYKKPYGSCLLISPFNYPFQLLFVPLIGLLAAGNTVVIKASPLVKNINKIIEKIIDELQAKEIIHFINNDNALEINEIFEANVDFDLIFFTGSEKTGKIIMSKYSHKLITIILELGGKSPVFIDDNVSIQKAVQKIIWGKFMNAGQTCIAPDYLLVKNNIYQIVVDEFKKQLNDLYSEKYLLSNRYGKLASKESYLRLKKFLENQKIIYGNQCYDNLLKISPTLVEVNDFNNKLMQEEIFGPILPIIKINEKNDVLNFILKYPNPLSIYLFSNDQKFIDFIFDKTNSGSFNVNDVVIQITKNLPFGGYKNSGIGTYHKKYSFDSFTYYRSYTKAKNYSPKLRFNPYQTSLKSFKKIFLFFKK